MGKIKTLRASGSRMKADVAIGVNKYGGDVTVLVEVNRNDPEVAAALEPLTSLLSTRAQGTVDSEALQSYSVDQLAKTVAEAKKSLEKDQRTAVAS
jgi:hypothetical protein